MEKIAIHIKKLLTQHEYVVIPGFGGLVIQQMSATISDNRIIAPLATIGFNALMTQNDGLLAIEIARNENISYRDALKVVSLEVEKLTSALKAGENVWLGELGSFKTDLAKNILFTPGEIDFLAQNFGLSTLICNKRTEKSTSDIHEIRIKIHKTDFYKYAAVLLIFIGLFFVSPKVSDVHHSNLATLGVWQNPAPETEISKEEKFIPEFTTAKKDTATSELVPPVNQATEKYHVIVGCMPTLASAQQYCTLLSDSHFTTARILKPIKTYRIAIQSFTNRSEAIKYMENLRKSDPKFETAWVLCDKE